MPNGVLVYFHCRSNTGFAIGRLELVFLRIAQQLAGTGGSIYFAYTAIDGPPPANLPPSVGVLQLNPATASSADLEQLSRWLSQHRIDVAIGFDQQPGLPIYWALRRGGVRTVVSYWGAPMSSLNTGLKLLAKRIEVALKPGPDLYIFESEAMRATGVQGRGVPLRDTAVVYLGVDAEEFHSPASRDTYAHEVFGLPPSAHIVIYSGHMEERKGVAVIVKAARFIAEQGREDIYFVLLGNQGDEAERFAPLYRATAAHDLVRFGGYRNDIPALLRSASVGVIASTGWDSFTRSAVEMAASGLPLIVSRLQGLMETVEEGVTGLTFTPGDSAELAQLILQLVDDPQARARFGAAARARVEARFTEDGQVEQLVGAIESKRSAGARRAGGP